MNSKGKGSFFSMETRHGRVANQMLYPVLVVIMLFVLNAICGGKMMTVQNLFIIFANCVVNAFIAWGVSYTWSTGPDFSVAAYLILGANIGGVLTVNAHLGYLGLFGGAILTAVVLQLLSTFLRIKLGMPAWVIGIAVCLIYEAFGVMYATTAADHGAITVTLGSTQCKEIIQMPWILILMLVGLVFMLVVHNRTTFGLNYQAVSCNPAVAGDMGINVNKTTYIGVVIGAVMIGIAAALSMCSSNRVAVASNLGSFGMISTGLCAWLLSSGMDKRLNPPLAIALSSFIISVIFNFLTFLGVPQGTWLDFILGCFIIIFLCLSAKSNEKEAAL